MEYPGEWFGGKTRGGIRDYGNKFEILIRDGNTPLFKEIVSYDKNNSEDKIEKYNKAKKILYNKCAKEGWIKNRVRYINKDEIEVQVGHGKLMKTDAKFISLIEEKGLYATEQGKRLKKYYTKIYLGKQNGKKIEEFFHTYVTGFEMVDHINRDTLDNRLCNLRKADYKINNGNKTFTTYDAKNSSGTRGVTYNTKENAWIAKIITNKLSEDGKKRTYCKSFKISTYGDKAKKLAIEHRKEMCEKFNNDEFDIISKDHKEKYRKRQRIFDENGDLIEIECKTCNKLLKIENFFKSSSGSYKSYCKSCQYKKKKIWLEKKKLEN